MHLFKRNLGSPTLSPGTLNGLLALSLLCCSPGATAAEPSPATPLNLPDPLTTSSGEAVTSRDAWLKSRRMEILELFRTHIYGRTPIGRPETLRFQSVETGPAMDGAALREQVRVSYSGPGGEGAINLLLFTPSNAKVPVPCFLLICNRSGAQNTDPTRKVKTGFWPAEEIIAQGFAAASFLTEDVAPDRRDSWEHGVHQIFLPVSERKPDSWGTIGAWAWGASRVMDYLETNPRIDKARVALVGHSRGGKTALWAGAQDERFALVISNESGSTGAAIARGKKGERIRDINRGFPYWFCDNYKSFNDRESELPVDQHMLLALIAPRLLYVASASEDEWAYPPHEFLAAVHATPVYRLFGLQGLGTTEFPAPEAPIHGQAVGYHLRTGKHDLTHYDWTQFMGFARKHWQLH